MVGAQNHAPVVAALQLTTERTGSADVPYLGKCYARSEIVSYTTFTASCTLFTCTMEVNLTLLKFHHPELTPQYYSAHRFPQ
jgi:hypothetical protein